MSAIKWHKNLSVGIEELDNQHQQLIEIINNLYDIIANQEDRKRLQNIIDQMTAYTEIHFATEEKYFKLYAYPHTAAHNKEHTLFTKKLVEFKEGFKMDSYTLSFQIMDFLQEWLIHHIINTDLKYSDFFLARGLK